MQRGQALREERPERLGSPLNIIFIVNAGGYTRASSKRARSKGASVQGAKVQAASVQGVQGAQAGSAQARFPKGPWRSRRGVTLTLRRSGLLTRKDMEAAGASPHAAEGNLGDESGSAPAPAPPGPSVSVPPPHRSPQPRPRPRPHLSAAATAHRQETPRVTSARRCA